MFQQLLNKNPNFRAYKSAFPNGTKVRRSFYEELLQTHRLYVIFIQPRSGSTWLTELISRGFGSDTPQEWFNRDFVTGDADVMGCPPPSRLGATSIEDYLGKIVKRADGAAGVQLSFGDAQALSQMIGKGVPIDRISWFYMRRRDIFGQAISFERSMSTRVWHSYEGGTDLLEAHKAEANAQLKAMKNIVNTEVSFEAFFGKCGISPTRLYYEDLTSDTVGTCERIGAQIGLKQRFTLPQTHIQKLPNAKIAQNIAALERNPRSQKILARRPATP